MSFFLFVRRFLALFSPLYDSVKRCNCRLLLYLACSSLLLSSNPTAFAQLVIPSDDGFIVIPISGSKNVGKIAYFNDFSSEDDESRLDQFVAYRDPFVVNHMGGQSDHAAASGINCTEPEKTRPQFRNKPAGHVYHCLPMSRSDLGHQMAFAMDTSGYGFVGALPDQVFTGLTEVSVDINTTSAGGRNFIEIKVIPANNVFVNGLPCIPDLPCNDNWDYDDIEAMGASTDSQEGTGMKIATPEKPDGFLFDYYGSYKLGNGDTQYRPCEANEFCFKVRTHEGNPSIRKRYQHIFRDNGNGTLAFGIERADGYFDWVEAPGSFPNEPVRVVIAFHNYTGTKEGNGPGANDNFSPSVGGFTWHWDELKVQANSTRSSFEYFSGNSAERIVTPNGCIAFSQGQRESPSNTDVSPLFHCKGDPELDL